MLMVGVVCELGMTCPCARGREGEVRDDAKGLGGVLGFQGMAKGGWLDLVHQVEAVWAQMLTLPATCLI